MTRSESLCPGAFLMRIRPQYFSIRNSPLTPPISSIRFGGLTPVTKGFNGLTDAYGAMPMGWYFSKTRVSYLTTL